MDFTKKELEVVEQAVVQGEQQLVELNDMQLSLIGGGTGEITPI